MRKYVSLGAAMMMGAVLGRENHATTLSSGHGVSKAIQTEQYAGPTHLERPVKLHPRHDSVGDVEADRESIISSPRDGFASRESLISHSRQNLKNRSRTDRNIRRKDSTGPKVKQHWYCGGRLVFQYGATFTCFDRSDGYWKQCWSLGNGNYKCYDRTNGKWEWPNWNERDFTRDNSHLTSIGTDGRLYTSPSRRVQGELSCTSSVHDAHTSVYSRDDFIPDEVKAASFYDDDYEGDMILSDRSIDRVKAAYYRPGGYESPRTSVYSRN